ncbi:hypothetical protein TNCV_3499511 [Trichonephila clavipes]|nr:hypothetical protein TNCV_3499511 [Trichonephila clavipes]
MLLQPQLYMADKDILQIVKSIKNIIAADSDGETEMNNASVPTSSGSPKALVQLNSATLIFNQSINPHHPEHYKSTRSYLDAHCNGEMNNKTDDMEQFVNNLMRKKAKKNIR